MSKPHTSEFNGGISLICVYVSYVQCTRMCAVCGQYAHDLTACAHLHAFTECQESFRVALLLAVKMDTPKPSQDKDRTRNRKERNRV